MSSRTFTIKTDILKSFEINAEKWDKYTCAYEIPTGEIIALVFMAEGSVVLDNVSLRIN